MPPTSSCSRRQPRWDSRPSNNRHARPRRMPEARLTMKFVRACSKMLRPSVTQVKSTLPPIKTILIAKSDLLAELSASSLKRAGVCGTFRKLTQTCGRLRNFPQAHSSVRAFAELSASFSQVCGAFAELSASSLKCAGRLRNFPQASRKCAGRLRKFPQAHSSVRDVCGSFRKHSSIFSETIAPSPKIKAGNPLSIPANFPLLAMETKGYFRASSILSFNLSMVPKPVCS